MRNLKLKQDRGRGKIWSILVIMVLALSGVLAWLWLLREPENLDTLADQTTTLKEKFVYHAENFGNKVSEVRDSLKSVRLKESVPNIGATNSLNEHKIPGAPPHLAEQNDSASLENTSPQSTASVKPNQSELSPQNQANQHDMSTFPEQYQAEIGDSGLTGTQNLQYTPEVVANALRENFAKANANATANENANANENATANANANDSRNANLSAKTNTPPFIRIDFLEDLAKRMVHNYVPATKPGKNGYLGESLQNANKHYGTGMKGLSWIQHIPNNRDAALQLVFTPQMLDALYSLYRDPFLDAMNRAAQSPRENGPALNASQRTEMFHLYSQRFYSLSEVLQSVAMMPDFNDRMAALKQDARRVVQTNSLYSQKVAELDRARKIKDEDSIKQKTHQANEALQDYRQALLNREKNKAHMALEIRKYQAVPAFDDDTLLFVASWIERRLEKNPDRIDAVQKSANLFLDLSQQFEK